MHDLNEQEILIFQRKRHKYLLHFSKKSELTSIFLVPLSSSNGLNLFRIQDFCLFRKRRTTYYNEPSAEALAFI